ncbi:hypothetical protein ACFE04_011997 [Oxalis oulophora]
MECNIAVSKPSSNASHLISKFTKVCKLRSIGVFHENQVQHSNNNLPCYLSKNSCPVSEDSSCVTEDNECDGEKAQHQHVGEDSVILKLFDTISALKLAYIQLQSAHIPYNPEKISDADKLVIAELETLCNLEKVCKERQSKISKVYSSHLELLKSEIDVVERILEKLKIDSKAKQSKISDLRERILNLDLENGKFVQAMKEENLKRRKEFVWNVNTFDDTFTRASKYIHEFAKPFINLMKASDWDLDMAANSVENAVIYSKRCHKKYAFEAYIARRMFHGMLLKSCNVDDVMRFDDPIDALIQNPNSSFAEFCREKYLLVVHPTMEASFFGNLDQRMLVSSGKHPRTPFYSIFAKMAKWIWILQGIATLIDPNAKLFFVKRGCTFSSVCMQPVEEDSGVEFMSGEVNLSRNVQFMVTPGFKIGETLLKARVYL